LKIVDARKFKQLGATELRRLGVAFNRAKHFVIYHFQDHTPRDFSPAVLRQQIMQQSKFAASLTPQMALF
jgi:predicted DNA-binding helix-hairpin-helix protein